MFRSWERRGISVGKDTRDAGKYKTYYAGKGRRDAGKDKTDESKENKGWQG